MVYHSGLISHHGLRLRRLNRKFVFHSLFLFQVLEPIEYFCNVVFSIYHIFHLPVATNDRLLFTKRCTMIDLLTRMIAANLGWTSLITLLLQAEISQGLTLYNNK